MASYKTIKSATASVLETIAANDERLTKSEIFAKVRAFDPTIRADEEDEILFGDALRVIARCAQVRANIYGKKFGQWCKANGFDDISKTARKDALWCAENWGLLDSDCLVDRCHPTNIRAAYNEAQASTDTPPPDTAATKVL